MMIIKSFWFENVIASAQNTNLLFTISLQNYKHTRPVKLTLLQPFSVK